MRKLLLLTTLLASPALGADLPVAKAPVYPAAFSWTGLYIGGFGLYAGNFTGVDLTSAGANLGAVPHGAGLGGEIGYYTDLNPLVLGLRFDAAYANLSDSGSIANSLVFSNATNYLGGASVDLGLPLSPDRRLLGYVTTGFAFGGAKPNLAAAGTSASISDTSTGWRAGAGLKYAIDQHWQVGIRGEYYQLGDRQLNLTDSIGAIIATSNNKYHIFEQTLGVDYKF